MDGRRAKKKEKRLQKQVQRQTEEVPALGEVEELLEGVKTW